MPKSPSAEDRLISQFIQRNYPELAKCEMSIGRQGKTYRVIVTDKLNVLHALQIDADEARADKKRYDQLIREQVLEYKERYHPELAQGIEIDVSPCGTFASVRRKPETS